MLPSVMKSIYRQLASITVIICCLGASKISDFEGCFPNACGKKGDYCRAPSLIIWKKYCESSSLQGLSASGVYSGVCYHEAENRDPFYRHYGVVLIDWLNSRQHFGGVFAFFKDENPYENIDIKAAKIKMPQFYADDHQIKWNTDHARVHLYPEMEASSQINYFLRSGFDDHDKLFLVGYLKGASYRVFCELDRNN
jgi:hypothetical protein